MSRRKVLVALAALAVSFGVSAAASQLGGVGTTSLGAGTAPLTSCTDAGVQTGFVLEGAMVTGVEVRGLPAECTGKALQVSVSTGTGPVGESSGVVAGATTTLALGTSVAASAVESLSVVVSG